MRANLTKIRWLFVIQHACIGSNAFITTHPNIPLTKLPTSSMAYTHLSREIRRRRRRSFGELSYQSSDNGDDKAITNNNVNAQRRNQYQNQDPYAKWQKQRPQQQQRGGQNQEMRQKLESSLTNLFDISQGTSPQQRAQEQADVLEQIGATARGGDGSSADDDKRITSPSFAKAPTLDEDMYLNSEKYLDEDGSIVGQGNSVINDDLREIRSVLLSDNPTIPMNMDANNNVGPKVPNSNGKSRGMNVKNIIDDQALLKSLADAQNNAQSKLSGDELHRQIFENEQGFLSQSESFRDTLTSAEDSEQKKKEKEAIAWRRGADYRRRQQDAMALMEREMAELENSVLSEEDAKDFANSSQNSDDVDGSNNDFFFASMEINASANGSSNSGYSSPQPTTILCSKCSALMTNEEIIVERKRGRPNPNQMICRQCQVESMKLRNGSPYLVGRLGRNGRPPLRMGLDEIAPSTDRVIRQKVERIRNMGPRTESITTDEIRGLVEDDPNASSQRTEEQANAWREQYMAAMTRRKPTTMNSSKSVKRNGTGNQVSNSSPSQQISSSLTTNAKPPSSDSNHRYSARLRYLEKIEERNRNSKIWDAAYKAALHRQKGIEETGVAYMSQSRAQSLKNNQTTNINSKPIVDPSAPKLEKANNEIKKLQAKIKELEGTVDDYKDQLETSSKRMRALQSLLDGMNKAIASQKVKKKRKALKKNNETAFGPDP